MKMNTNKIRSLLHFISFAILLCSVSIAVAQRTTSTERPFSNGRAANSVNVNMSRTMHVPMCLTGTVAQNRAAAPANFLCTGKPATTGVAPREMFLPRRADPKFPPVPNKKILFDSESNYPIADIPLVAAEPKTLTQQQCLAAKGNRAIPLQHVQDYGSR